MQDAADPGSRLASLAREDFAPCVGEPFRLETDGATLTLSLLRADDLGPRAAQPRRRRPFSLVFLGPGEPVLPQRIYRLQHATLGALEIFLVPIGQDERGVRYESVFS